MKKILFYEDKYYLFSNFSAHTVTYHGQLYPTSEHAYQAAKFESGEIRKAIMRAQSPLEAKHLANDVYREQRRSDWDDVKVDVMYQIVKAKLLQQTEVRDALMETLDEEIIENSPIDYFWGCGEDGTGENQLGKVWMKLRKELRENMLHVA